MRFSKQLQTENIRKNYWRSLDFKKVQTLGMALIDLLKLYIRIIILCLFKKSLTISRQAPFLHNLKIVNYINFATKVSTHKGLRIKFTIFFIRLYCKMNFMIPLHNVYFSPTTIKRILCSFPSISLTDRNNVHSLCKKM